MATIDQDRKFIFINKTPAKLCRTRNERYVVAAHIGKTSRGTKAAISTRLAFSLKAPYFHVERFPVDKRSQYIEDSAVRSLKTPDQQDGRKSSLSCCTTHPEHPNLSPVCFKGNSDPFSSAAVNLSAFMWDIVQHSFRFLVFSSHPSSPAHVYRTQIGDLIASRMPIRDNITSDVGIHAILAAGYLVKAQTVEKNSKEEKTLRLHSERCKLKCIGRIRHDLDANINLDTVVMLLRLLISVEFYSGDYAAALTHLGGLKAVAMLNTTMWANAHDFMIVADVGISLATLQRPFLDPATYDSGPRYNQLWDKDLTSTAHTGISPGQRKSDLSAFKSLGNQTHDLAVGVEEVVEIMRMLTSGISLYPSLTASVMTWLSRRASALAAGLLTCYVDGKEALDGPPDTAGSSSSVLFRHALKAATSIAILLFLTPFSMEQVSEADFSRVFKAIEPLLRICADQVSDLEHSNDGTAHAYLWTVFLCAVNDDLFYARGHTTYSGWTRVEFGRLCRVLCVEDRQQATKILKTGLWSGDLTDEFLDRLMTTEALNNEDRDVLKPLFSKSEWTGLLWRHFVGMSQAPP